jgi:hypothetical protein
MKPFFRSLCAALCLTAVATARVAHLGQAVGQNMLEEACQKLGGGQTHPFDLLTAVVAVSKGDLALLHRLQARLADGDAKDAAAQVSQDLFSLAGVLGMDNPIVLPELGRELIQQAGGAQSATKLGAEDAGKGAHWDQKGRVLGVRAAGADQQMDMGMIAGSCCAGLAL